MSCRATTRIAGLASSLLLASLGVAGCGGDDGPWYDTAPDPDLSYLPLGDVAFVEEPDALTWTEGSKVTAVDAYLPASDHAPVVVLLPGALAGKERYRWFGATLASHGVATFIVQPPGAFGSTAETLATLEAAADRADWTERLDLGRVVLAGHSAGAVAQVGLTDVAACQPGFCAPGDAMPPALRGLILLGYHNQTDGDQTAPMAAAEVPWLLISGTRDGLATPEKVGDTLDRIEDRPLHWIQIDGANHFQLTDYVDPATDLLLDRDGEPTVGNRAARATAATYLAAFAHRYLLGDPVADDLDASDDPRVIADSRQPRLVTPSDTDLPRLLSEQLAVAGLTDAEDAADHADVVATAIYRGDRYLLVRNAVTGAQVFRLDADGSATRVPMPDGATGGFYDNPNLEGLLGAMAVFHDELYVGVTSGVQGAARRSAGAELWAYDGERWRPVISRRVDDDPVITVAAITGCDTSSDDPALTIEVTGAIWPPGQWVGGYVDDVDQPRGDGAPLMWTVIGSGADTLTLRVNDLANARDAADACDALTAGDRLSLRIGWDESGFGAPWTRGIDALAVFADRLYVGTAFEYEDGAELWSTADGTNFEIAVSRAQLGMHPSGVPITTSFTALSVSAIGGAPTLYVGATGSEDYGARLLAIDAGGQMRFVVDDAVDDDDDGLDEAGLGGSNHQIASIAEFAGRLWLTTMNFEGLELFSTEDGVTMTREVAAGWGDPTQLAARLVVEDGYLWALDVAFVQSAGELHDKSGYGFRTADGERWQMVTAHAFGTNAVQISQLFRLGDRLVATSSGAALAQPLTFRRLRFYQLTDHDPQETRP